MDQWVESLPKVRVKIPNELALSCEQESLLEQEVLSVLSRATQKRPLSFYIVSSHFQWSTPDGLQTLKRDVGEYVLAYVGIVNALRNQTIAKSDVYGHNPLDFYYKLE